MSKIIEFTGVTRHDLDADRALESLKGRLEGFVILGYDKDGNEFFSSSIADGGEVNWLIDRWKMKLLNMPDSL